jgi:hypothetical protein
VTVKNYHSKKVASGETDLYRVCSPLDTMEETAFFLASSREAKRKRGKSMQMHPTVAQGDKLTWRSSMANTSGYRVFLPET